MKIFRSAVLIFALRICGAALLFFVYSFLSKVEGEERLAEVAVFLAVLTICGTVARGGLDQYLLREMPGSDACRRDRLAANAVALASLVGLCCAVVAGVVWHSYMLGLGVLLFSIFSIVPEVYRASGSAIQYAVLRNFAFNFFLATGVGALYLLDLLVLVDVGIVLSALFAVLLSLIYFFGVYRFYCFQKIGCREMAGLAKGGMLLALFQFLVIAHTYGYNLVLDFLATPQDVARFAVYLQVVLIFGMFSTSVGVFIGRDVAVAVRQGDFRRVLGLYRHACYVSVAVTGPIFMGLIFYGPLLFQRLFDFPAEVDLVPFYIMASTAFINSATGPKFTVLNMLGLERVVLRAGSVLTVFVAVFLFFSAFYDASVTVLFVAISYALFSGGLAVVMSLYALKRLQCAVGRRG